MNTKIPSSALSFLVVLVSVPSLIVATTHPDVIYIDRHCGSNFNISHKQDMRIKMGPDGITKGNYSCALNISTSDPQIQGITLVAHFNTFYSDYNNDDCVDQAIEIQSDTGKYVLPPYCKQHAPTASFYLGKFGIVEVFSNFSGGSGSFDPPSFDLMISSAVVKSNSSCPDDYFDCEVSRDICIHNELTCNGYNDCGNNRDEEEGCGLLPMVIAIIAVSVFVIGIVVLTLSICCYKRRRGRGMYIQM